jgi:hypothetical protein
MGRDHRYAVVHLAIVLIVIWNAHSGCASGQPAGPAAFAHTDQGGDNASDEARPVAAVVVDEDDVPVPDAAVGILREHVEQQATRTDSAGRFQVQGLPEGPLAELVIRKPGRATICVSVPFWYDSTADTEVRLLQPVEAKLAGIVVEKGTGRPVAGVGLTVTKDRNRPGESREPVLSHAEGTFSISALSAGRYVLRLAPTEEGPAEWVAAPIFVALGVGDVVTGLRVEVSNGGLVEIAVTDARSGRPIEKARVSAVRRAGAALSRSVSNVKGDAESFAGVTDAQGVARLRLRAGTYQVAGAACAGYSPASPGQTIVVTDGATEHAVVTLAPNVSGVVRDPQGRPVAGAQVKIVAGGQAEVTSDGQGKFEIAWDRAVPFSTRPLVWLVARHEARNLAARVDIGKDTSTLDVQLAACPVLTGRIVDPQGQALGGAWVYVALDVPDWGDTPWREEHIQADAQGRFEIAALAAGGRYTLHAYADAYGSKAFVVEVGDATGGSRDLGTLALPAANLSVSGRVIDMRSKPIAYARVYGCGPGQPLRLTAQTDAEGRFLLAGVCAGRIDLGVDPSRGGRRLWAEVSAPRDAAGVEVVAR